MSETRSLISDTLFGSRWLAGTSCRRARGRCPASHAESRPFGSDPSRLRQPGCLRAALAMPCSIATPICMRRHGASKSRQQPSSRTCWRHSWNETEVSGRQEPPILPDDHPVCEQATRPPAAYGTSTLRPIQLMAAALEDRLNARWRPTSTMKASPHTCCAFGHRPRG